MADVVASSSSPTRPATRWRPSSTRSTEASDRRASAVVLADNGSTDGSVEAAAAATRRRRWSRPAATSATARAANIGVAHTDTEFVVVANPDVVWSPGSLDDAARGRRIAGRGPASLGPLIQTPDGAIYPSARALPSLGRGIGHALFGWWWPANPWTAAYRRERGAPTEGAVGWLSGSCLLLRRKAFDAVGGFDPSYFMYFEDVDLGDRLGRAGWQNVYVPDAPRSCTSAATRPSATATG